MHPQPPLDAPAPSPSEAAILSRKKWEWLWGVGVVSIIILALAGLTPPLTAGRGKSPEQTEAVSNARQIGLALHEFEEEYGSFPDALTSEVVRQNSNTDLILGTKSSNDFLRQLLASQIAQSERMFYANIAGTRRPDEVMTKGKALEKGECGFTYLLGLTSMGNPSRPLVVAPMIPNTDRFDPNPFRGNAIILQMDGSLAIRRIEKDGYVNVAGQNMMDPTNPIWDGHPPMIAWPEL